MRLLMRIDSSLLMLTHSNLLRLTGLSLQTLTDSSWLRPIHLRSLKRIDWHLLMQTD